MKTPTSVAKSPIDWDQVRGRLAAAAQKTAEALNPSPEHRRAILEARARGLARPTARSDSDGDRIEVLMLTLGDECYALETQHIRQVVRPNACTPVPCDHEFLKGVINLDGEILAVFDLGRALEVSARATGAEAEGPLCVVVLGHDQDGFGVSVDSAREVTTLRLDELLDPAVHGDDRRCLMGLTADAVGVLDGRGLLADERFQVDRTG